MIACEVKKVFFINCWRVQPAVHRLLLPTNCSDSCQMWASVPASAEGHVSLITLGGHNIYSFVANNGFSAAD